MMDSLSKDVVESCQASYLMTLPGSFDMSGTAIEERSSTDKQPGSDFNLLLSAKNASL